MLVVPDCELNMEESYVTEEIPGNKIWCNEEDCIKNSRYPDHSKSIHQMTEYLSEQEAQKYEVKIKDGKLYKDDDTLLTTDSHHGYIFVLTHDNKLYCGIHSDGGNEDGTKRFHHSSFNSGKPVATAGYLICNDGIISSIKWVSGHYRPTSGTICKLLEYLLKNGVDIEDITLLNRNDDVIPYREMCSTGECGEYVSGGGIKQRKTNRTRRLKVKRSIKKRKTNRTRRLKVKRSIKKRKINRTNKRKTHNVKRIKW
jgi:hypothetical protein